MKTKTIIVAAPSGAGKNSFVDRVISEIPQLVDVITYTTRSMRQGEREGFPYFFVTREKFEELVQKNFFIEWAQVHQHFYGTPFDQIEQAWKNNRCVIMDIDVQGAATLRQKIPDSRQIFILPPSIDELRRRVTKREGGVPPHDLELRMKNAEQEISASSQFDVLLVNDQFEESYAKFKKIIEDWLS